MPSGPLRLWQHQAINHQVSSAYTEKHQSGLNTRLVHMDQTGHTGKCLALTTAHLHWELSSGVVAYWVSSIIILLPPTYHRNTKGISFHSSNVGFSGSQLSVLKLLTPQGLTIGCKKLFAPAWFETGDRSSRTSSRLLLERCLSQLSGESWPLE